MMNILKLFIRSLIVLAIAFSLGIFYGYGRIVRQALPISQTETITVTEGEGPRAIAQKLVQEEILDTDRSFLAFVLITGKRNTFYPGVYELPPGSSIADVVRIMTSGKKDQVIVRIKEGSRIKDIAAEVAKKLPITAVEFEALASVAQYEGYLFPDTYYFTKETTATQIIKTMRDNFDKKTKDLALTPQDVVMASIVEREAGNDSERAKIAGLYLNRLAIDMALQADPTVQYAKGSWSPITVADYTNVVSPYNTYLNKGLPPTAIASPSLASLKAVKAPEQHDFYYFFHTADGQTIFSRNGTEHNANKAKYLR